MGATVAGQRSVIALLSTPGAYPPHAGPLERIDTHISIVWLAGERAYKLKRAVRYPYVDFSTPEKRHRACLAEVELNRRTAPSMYLGVVEITRETDGSLILGGHGTPVDWVVEMRRFDQETLFDRLAERGALSLDLMQGLADAIVRLHATATPRPDRGGVANMAWVVDGNEVDFDGQGAGVLDRGARRRLIADSRAAVDRHAALLEARRRDGLVRWCHGDLHLRNVCLLDGRPTLFDAIEFSEDISCVDVLYDLAFLLMDLWRRDLRRHANAVFNEYLSARHDASDLRGLALLPLFLSCRAAVRAKTSVSAAAVQPEPVRAEALRRAARDYLARAQALLQPAPPRLVAIGGLSGSGKSTLAQRIAPGLGPAPGAVVLRSDVIRKALVGAAPTMRLGAEAYTAEASARVYEKIAELARDALQAGHAVVADAVHARPSERAGIEAVARAAGVPFAGFWIDVPAAALAARLARRGADVSDADPTVLEKQLRYELGDVEWRKLDGSLDAEATANRAEELL